MNEHSTPPGERDSQTWRSAHKNSELHLERGGIYKTFFSASLDAGEKLFGCEPKADMEIRRRANRIEGRKLANTQKKYP
jgi:hypothetical protein